MSTALPTMVASWCPGIVGDEVVAVVGVAKGEQFDAGLDGPGLTAAVYSDVLGREGTGGDGFKVDGGRSFGVCTKGARC